MIIYAITLTNDAHHSEGGCPPNFYVPADDMMGAMVLALEVIEEIRKELHALHHKMAADTLRIDTIEEKCHLVDGIGYPGSKESYLYHLVQRIKADSA